MNRRPHSEGIYFVVRFPAGWKLLAFRFDEHPEGGHLKFWEDAVAPALAKVWAPQLFRKLSAYELARHQNRLRFDLAENYDGFPRGRVTWVEEIDRFVIYHGRNLKRSMKITRQTIEAAFGITGRADWEFDEHEQCTASSAAGVRSALHLREQWKTTDLDFR